MLRVFPPVVLMVCLSIPVQVTDCNRLSEMTHNVLVVETFNQSLDRLTHFQTMWPFRPKIIPTTRVSQGHRVYQNWWP